MESENNIAAQVNALEDIIVQIDRVVFREGGCIDNCRAVICARALADRYAVDGAIRDELVQLVETWQAVLAELVMASAKTEWVRQLIYDYRDGLMGNPEPEV